MALIIPRLDARLVDKFGLAMPPWTTFFQQFVQAPAAAIPITVGGSPFTYTASEPGVVSIAGGTISTINFIRGTVTVNTNKQALIPVCIKDQVEVFYNVNKPTMNFFPGFF